MSETTMDRVLCPTNSKPAVPYCALGDCRYYIEKSSDVIFQHPMPNVADMSAFSNAEYQAGAYESYFRARELKMTTARRRLDRIQKLARGKKLLDIGCSVGFFMEAAQERGFEVSGVEFSSVAISKAAPSVRSGMICGDVNTLLKERDARYDVVTAFDIVEHTHDPATFVSEIAELLTPGGVFVLSTPDTGHFLRRLMGRAWPMLQPMQHTVLFSRDAMRQLLEANGFTDVVIEDAGKVMTIKYLGEQLQQTSRGLAAVYGVLTALLPKSLKERHIEFRIGEFIAFARKAG